MVNVHLIGVAGVGMRALAQLLLQSGYQVSGSDLNFTPALQDLQRQGAKIYQGHVPDYVAGAQIVVRSSAIKDEHVEWLAAKSKGLTLMHRSEMLEKLCAQKQVIAVTGSHGKTSTTAMIVHALRVLGLNPGFAIGSDWAGFSCGAYMSSGNIFVVEADESDASFLKLKPKVGLVLNLEREHLSFYQGSFAKLCAACKQFMQNSELLVYNQSDQIVSEIKGESFHKQAISFSDKNDADVIVKLLGSSTGSAYSLSGVEGVWSVFGEHMLQNLAAAYAALQVFGVGVEDFIRAMQSFVLPGRRFQELGVIANSEILVIDDYGHHPNEIAATINSVRLKYKNKRLVMAFQPHKYSRLRDEFAGFVKVLELVDKLILLPVYPAGEDVITGYTSTELSRSLGVMVCHDLQHAKKQLLNQLESNDVLLCQGAGDITLLAQELSGGEYV